MTKKTTTTVTYPMVSAILKADEFIEDSQGFSHVSDIQKMFIADFYNPSISDLSRITEIKSIAHSDANVINNWLQEQGFSISLSPIKLGGIGIASMLDLLGMWASKGSDVFFHDEDHTQFPGVKISDSALSFYRIAGDQNFVVELKTFGGDSVYLKMEPEVPDGLNLVKHVEAMHPKMQKFNQADEGYEGLIFPKIDLDQQYKLDWLIGFRIDSTNPEIPFYEIEEALQQTKLKMNKDGFRVKSAVAIGMAATCILRKIEPYLINKPFLMWVTRPQFAKPLFVGYLNKDVWKDPEGLEM